MNILIIGNCQAEAIGSLLSAMMSKAHVEHIQLLPTDIARLETGALNLFTLTTGECGLATAAENSELILIQNGHQIIKQFEVAFPSQVSKVRMFPRFAFSGFHPDQISIGTLPPGPTGPYHSSIVIYGWVNGLSENETISLFREEVFSELGFFDNWSASVKFLLSEAEKTGISLDGLIDKWTSRGVWMHTFNHPKIEVLADLARTILEREGIQFAPAIEGRVVDPLAQHVTWGVYPEIAARLGLHGGYDFKRGGRIAPGVPPPPRYNLEGFVSACFERYKTFSKELFLCDRLSSPRYQQLRRFVKAGGSSISEKNSIVRSSPYQNLPDHQFWRRAVERLAKANVDPVVRASFKLKKNDKVATAGSCFAQHIARTLVKNGFRYFVSECGDGLSLDESHRRNYGVFSARFGNLYTTRQLLQLFDRAYGRFTPTESAWVRSDGKLVDPFRPQIEPDGYTSVEDLERSREVHFKSVRNMFEQLDVFIFTLGLTEAWRSRIDGAVYPLAPGVAAGEMVAEKYEFVNFTASEVTSDLQLFVLRLLRVNPRARVILTVSPVPLIATYEDRHVMVSTTYSKSALRVAAEEICQRNTSCTYFPSYEIITGNYAKSEYFESDLRSVKQEGVDHVMRLFLKHYGSDVDGNALEMELMRENDAAADIVCDEEAIET